MGRFKQQADQCWAELLAQCVSKPLRTVQQFAEEEIVLPDDGGPFGGEPFRVEAQPYVRLLFKEIDSRQWLEIYAAGPNQSGKTLSAWVVPLLYVLFELRKNALGGVPLGDMISDKWTLDIEPVMRARRKFREVLPKIGQGSQKGKVKDRVDFANGRSLKFVTKGGSDQSKAGYTAPWILVTEAAGWSEGTSTSKESKPLDQLRARQLSASGFDDEGNVATNMMLIVEGTVTDEYDLPVSERPYTTDSKIACPCIHCGHYVTPVREHLKGWQGQPDVHAAAKATYWECPSCGEAIDNDQRRIMNISCVLLHKGQSIPPLSPGDLKKLQTGKFINGDGNVEGEIPKVTKLYFHWTAFNNLFRKNADFGRQEWEASQLDDDTPERENAEKALCQQTHSIPYTPKILVMERLNRKVVRRRRDEFTWGTIPGDAQYVVAGIDVGKWTCWYYVLALRSNGLLSTPIYGSLQTNLLHEDRLVERHEIRAIQNCLTDLFEMCDRGWTMEGSGDLRACDLVVADSNYKPGAVFDAVRGFDKKRFLPLVGRGKSVRNSQIYASPVRKTAYIRKISEDGWHLEYSRKWRGHRLVVDADLAKTEIQNCLRVRLGQPGSLALPKAPQDDHKLVSRHLAAEIKDADGNWVKSGANHLLDCAAYAWMAGSYLGWDVRDFEGVESNEESWFEAMLNAC